MKKVTVNEAVTAVAVADTVEAIVAVLMMCTKLTMVKVYKAIMGMGSGQLTEFKLYWKKDELARSIAYQLHVKKANEEFKAKSFDEKYEILTACEDNYQIIHSTLLLTVEELQAVVIRLGLPLRYEEGEEFDHLAHDVLSDDVIRELKARLSIAKVEALMKGDDEDALKEELRHTHPETLKRLLAKYGVNYEEDKSLYGIHMQDALYKYYLSNKHTRTQAEAQPEATTLMAENSDGTLTVVCEGHSVSYEEFLGEKSSQHAMETESRSTFKEAVITYYKEHPEIEVSEDEGEVNMKREALAYVQEQAELEDSLLTEEERQEQAQAIAEAQARVEAEAEAEDYIREEALAYIKEHAELEEILMKETIAEEDLLTEEERKHNEQVIAEAQARVELAAEYEDDAAIWSRQELENIAGKLGLDDFDWMSDAELIASIVMKDACMYDGLLAEKKHMILEAQGEAEDIYLKVKEAIKNTTFTAGQCRLISDLKAEIRAKGLKDGGDDMTVSQYLWKDLNLAGLDGIMTWDEVDDHLRSFLAFFGVTGIETLDTVDYLALIDCVSYWIGEQVYNKAESIEYAPNLDEDAYTPNYEPNEAVLQDTPGNEYSGGYPLSLAHDEPEENKPVSYEEVRRAYNDYSIARWDYEEGNLSYTVADEAYRKYLTLLTIYRKGAMPERDEVLKWIRARYGEAALPVDRLECCGKDYLIELSHKCGIHATDFRGISCHDMAVRLIREAGIETSAKTFYEFAKERRKDLQAGLHELWQKRNALSKAQRILGERGEDIEALSDMWEPYQEEVDYLMREYRKYNEYIRLGSKYEREAHTERRKIA